MNFDNLKAEMYHSLVLYAIIADAPRLLHVPDMVNAAIDGKIDILENDFETLMIDFLIDIPEFLMSKIDDTNSWKEDIRTRIKNINTTDLVDKKNQIIDIINFIISKLHAIGHKSIPILGKLNDNN